MKPNFFADWHPRYSVGHPLLDAQHKKLLRLCQDVIACTEDDAAYPASLHAALRDLNQSIQEHFASEEAILESSAYPLLDYHKEEHVEYQSRMDEFLRATRQGCVSKESLTHYLSRWWSEHILCSDKQYSGFIKGNSLYYTTFPQKFDI